MKERMKERMMDLLMPLVPKNQLSHWVGRLAHQPLPEPLASRSVAAFASYYRINMNEAEFPLEHYRTIGELFTRRLKDGVRPLADVPVVHPADAKITEAGVINQMTLIQAKGFDYRVEELLRSAHFAPSFEGGAYFTYYLCPTDYHRVHSPVDGKIIWSAHVPGELWPVNAWSVKKVPQLFAVNERVVTLIQTSRGLAALVMVAATNVGNMIMTYDQQIQTASRRGLRSVREHSYSPPIDIQRGQEVGLFSMGSTVVMLYQPGVVEVQPEDYAGRHVKMGQGLS